MARKRKRGDERVITFTPDGDGYGTVSCSWEDEPRTTRIAEWTLENLAHGCHAELRVKAAW